MNGDHSHYTAVISGESYKEHGGGRTKEVPCAACISVSHRTRREGVGCCDSSASVFFLTTCSYFNNAYYAKVGGVSTGEMNRLELEFLFRLNFRLQVTVDNFFSFCKALEHKCPQPCTPPPPQSLPLPLVDASNAPAERVVNTPPRDKEMYRIPAALARIVSAT